MLHENLFVSSKFVLNSIKYYVFFEPNQRGRKIAHNKKVSRYINKNSACFAGITKYIEDTLSNRVVYFTRYKQSKYLKRYQIEHWLKVSKRAGLLPSYINIRRVMSTGEFVLNLEKHSNNELYMYLTVARMALEHFNTVNTVLNLMDHGVDYFAALVAAITVGPTNNVNHIFTPWMWSRAGKSFDRKLKLDRVAALAAFSKVMHTKSVNIDNTFCCNATIETLSNAIYLKYFTDEYISSMPVLEIDEPKWKPHIERAIRIGLTNYKDFTDNLVNAKRVDI